MKRTIITGFFALCALVLFAQQEKEKVMYIKLTDGTVLEYHVSAIRGEMYFKGKAVVKDDDYTQISRADLVLDGTRININLTAEFCCDDPNVTTGNYMRDWGIVYSTSPDVTIENGTLIDLSNLGFVMYNNDMDLTSGSISFKMGESVSVNSSTDVYADLEYNTTYYFRSYVRCPTPDFRDEQYFYSKEQSVNTGKPSMEYYDIHTIPAYAAEYGYVFPTEEAWATFDEQYPYFECCINDVIFAAHWNDYLTPERHEALKAQCTTVHECAEGKLYLLDTVGEEFFEYLLGVYAVEYTMPGYTELLDESTHTVGAYVECDASWNVPGNGYWKYTADEKKNPSIQIQLSKDMLANYRYKVELTLAPNTDPEETLPSKVTVKIFYATGGVTIANKLVTNVGECTVITADELVSNSFGEASIEILSDMKIGPEGKKYSPILRVAQIKVIPCGPSSESMSVE